MVEDVDVQLSLLFQPAEREVAAAHERRHRVDLVIAMEQVELRVQPMAEEELHHHLALAQLPGQLLQHDFVRIRGRPEGQLIPELLGELTALTDGALRIEALGRIDAQSLPKLFVRIPLHAHQQPAGPFVAARPALDEISDRLPAPQIEVAGTKVRSCGHGHRVAKRWQKLPVDVVEDARHAEVRE